MYLKAKVIEPLDLDPFKEGEEIFILSRSGLYPGYFTMDKKGFPSSLGHVMWDVQLEVSEVATSDLFQISLLILKQETECR